MIVYMIKCDKGWYGPRGRWVTKDRARIWPSMKGVQCAKGVIGKEDFSKVQVLEFELLEKF